MKRLLLILFLLFDFETLWKRVSQKSAPFVGIYSLITIFNKIFHSYPTGRSVEKYLHKFFDSLIRFNLFKCGMNAPKIIFTLIFCLIPIFSMMVAQEDLPEPQMQSAPGAPPPPGLVVPIDSGLIVLLFSGLFLGIYYFSAYSNTKQ